jgi:hypothetical protein
LGSFGLVSSCFFGVGSGAAAALGFFQSCKVVVHLAIEGLRAFRPLPFNPCVEDKIINSTTATKNITRR